MDLAQAASIFKKSSNYRALGICYNNIANIQYKNAQYNEASLNFKKAINSVNTLIQEVENVALGLKDKTSRKEIERLEAYNHFNKIKAHRVF